MTINAVTVSTYGAAQDSARIRQAYARCMDALAREAIERRHNERYSSDHG